MEPNTKTLRLIELFGSVQGETSFSGLPTTFIRLASCNLRCTWCDTPYSFGRGDPYTLENILGQVKQNHLKWVCITGGEPLLQENVYPLMQELVDLGYIVSLETSGSLCTQRVPEKVAIILDIKCPGSGMESKNLFSNLNHLKNNDEVKFVIKDENDYRYSLDICRKFALFEREKQPLFSPVHDELDPKLLIDWIKKDKIPARLNLQVHKFIWSKDTKGV